MYEFKKILRLTITKNKLLRSLSFIWSYLFINPNKKNSVEHNFRFELLIEKNVQRYKSK